MYIECGYTTNSMTIRNKVNHDTIRNVMFGLLVDVEFSYIDVDMDYGGSKVDWIVKKLKLQT